jgi:hypothetical protein
MMRKELLALSMLAALTLVLAGMANAQSGQDPQSPYKYLKTIPIPTGLTGFDISWVDPSSGRYYLADRGDATVTPAVSPTIDVIDTVHDKFLFSIPLSSPGNGVVAIRDSSDRDDRDEPSPGQLVVGTNDSNTLFIDLEHPFNAPFAVSTGGQNRADELAFDPADHLILIANDRVPDLFVTLIKTTNVPQIVGKIYYDGSVPGNPVSTGGIEQPVWDGAKHKFYISIPSTQANATGEVDEINPITMKITRSFPTTCGPAGLALLPGQRLITSCGDVITIENGSVTHVPNVGADEIWFNQGDDRVYFGGYQSINVPVVNALPLFNQITSLVVGKINTPPTPNDTTHSVAADSENNHIFVPVTHEGVKVYTERKGSTTDSDN